MALINFSGDVGQISHGQLRQTLEAFFINGPLHPEVEQMLAAQQALRSAQGLLVNRVRFGQQHAAHNTQRHGCVKKGVGTKRGQAQRVVPGYNGDKTGTLRGQFSLFLLF